MPSRRKAREFALQMLYQLEMSQMGADEVAPLFWRTHDTDAETRRFAERLFRGSSEQASRIDELIARHSRHWNLGRMAAVDRNVLRLAIWELMHRETPVAVVIDEAIEVARKYSGSESGEFVNGILDSVRKELERNDERGNRRGGDGSNSTATA